MYSISMNKGELIGVEYLLDQTGKTLQYDDEGEAAIEVGDEPDEALDDIDIDDPTLSLLVSNCIPRTYVLRGG